MIISDCHISNNTAIIEVFPLASHGICRFHMNQNVKNRFKNDKMTTIFDHALRVYRTPVFDNQIKNLRKIHKKAYLIEVDVHKWSHAYCPVRRYSMMTTNIIESLNYTLRLDIHASW